MSEYKPFSVTLAETIKNRWRMFNPTGDGKSGFERINQKDPIIKTTPKFYFSPNEKFFTIGSCFARNIERALAENSIHSVSAERVFPASVYETSGGPDRSGLLNAYNVHSMLDLVKLPSHPNANSVGLLNLGDDEYLDMMVSGTKPLNEKDAANVRSGLLDVYSKLGQATAIIITLGYTESWFDTVDKIFVNRAPGGTRKLQRHGNRYEFLNVGALDALKTLNELVLFIKKTSPDARIIITVSPVPLNRTWTTRDIVSANLFSKSTLVSAAMSVADTYDFTDYFPSFEMVTYAKENTWKPDGVHVMDSRVNKVVGHFIKTHMRSDGISLDGSFTS